MGPIISRLFTCSKEEIKNKNKKQRVLALVLSLWRLRLDALALKDTSCYNMFEASKAFAKITNKL
jgi:hypothetical protein